MHVNPYQRVLFAKNPDDVSTITQGCLVAQYPKDCKLGPTDVRNLATPQSAMDWKSREGMKR